MLVYKKKEENVNENNFFFSNKIKHFKIYRHLIIILLLGSKR
jgi:hypothetical protein